MLNLSDVTMAVHVRYKCLYISLPPSAKQQREMTSDGGYFLFLFFLYLHLELNAGVTQGPCSPSAERATLYLTLTFTLCNLSFAIKREFVRNFLYLCATFRDA